MILKNEKTTKEKFYGFLRKYSYIILGITVLAIVTTIIIVSATNNKVIDKNNIDNVPLEPVDSTAVNFYLPVLNCTAIKDYSDTKLMYNDTLRQWEAHMALDLKGNAGDNVFAALDGKVVETYDNYLDGKVLVLEHKDGLRTVYKSMGSTSNLKIGDSVSKGQVIGTIGTSASEAHLGNHLHFEVEENGRKIDPSGFLDISNK